MDRYSMEIRKIILFVVLLFCTEIAFGGPDRELRAVGASNLLLQTGGSNTRIAIDPSGVVSFPGFSTNRIPYIDASNDFVTDPGLLFDGTTLTFPITDGTFLTGNGSNVKTEVTISGDINISNTGVAVIQSGAVVLTTDVTGILPVANGGTGSATQNFVDLTTNQTVDGLKTFDKELTLLEIATPSNPAAGDRKFYCTAADCFVRDSSGTEESLTGAGGGGTGDDVELRANTGIAGSVATSALTVALKVKDGSTDPSGGDPVDLSFRSVTLATGGYVSRSVTGALSLVVPSGATLGSDSAVESEVYVYAIDNAGTVELAVSLTPILDETVRYTTVALSAASDSKHVLYSTTLRTDLALRFLGSIISSQATAGTWLTSPTVITTGNKPQDLIVYLKDEKSNATDGGSFVTGDWRTRDLNVLSGARGFTVLSSNQFTLSPGTYEIEAACPGLNVNAHKCKLRNTAGSDVIIGDNQRSDSASGMSTNSLVRGSFTITATATFEMQHRGGVTRNGDGFGISSNFSVIEVYTNVRITKVK